MKIARAATSVWSWKLSYTRNRQESNLSRFTFPFAISVLNHPVYSPGRAQPPHTPANSGMSELFLYPPRTLADRIFRRVIRIWLMGPQQPREKKRFLPPSSTLRALLMRLSTLTVDSPPGKGEERSASPRKVNRNYFVDRIFGGSCRLVSEQAPVREISRDANNHVRFPFPSFISFLSCLLYIDREKYEYVRRI